MTKCSYVCQISTFTKLLKPRYLDLKFCHDSRNYVFSFCFCKLKNKPSFFLALLMEIYFCSEAKTNVENIFEMDFFANSTIYRSRQKWENRKIGNWNKFLIKVQLFFKQKQLPKIFITLQSILRVISETKWSKRTPSKKICSELKRAVWLSPGESCQFRNIFKETSLSFLKNFLS